MYNQMTAFGRLVRDPELKYVNGPQGQVACCEVTIACDDHSHSGDTKTAFLDFVFWAGRGEAIAQHLKKGDPILAVGSARTESWQTAEGQKRSRLRFRGREFKFIPRQQAQPQIDQGPPPMAPTPGGFDDADIPF